MLEWSLSGHCMLALITPQGASKWWLKKTPSARCSELHFSFKPSWIYLDFDCVLQMVFWTSMKDFGSGAPFNHQKLLRTKQMQVNPKAKRVYPIGLANHIQLQLSRLWKIEFDSPPHQMQMGHPYVADFNTLKLSRAQPWLFLSNWSKSI